MQWGCVGQSEHMTHSVYASLDRCCPAPVPTALAFHHRLRTNQFFSFVKFISGNRKNRNSCNVPQKNSTCMCGTCNTTLEVNDNINAPQHLLNSVSAVTSKPTWCITSHPLCCTQRWTPTVVNQRPSLVKVSWQLQWSVCHGIIPKFVTKFQREVPTLLEIPKFPANTNVRYAEGGFYAIMSFISSTIMTPPACDGRTDRHMP